MPGDKLPATCPSCRKFLTAEPSPSCRYPTRHDVQKPGKGFDPPYVADAVTAVEWDEDEEPEKGKPLC